jgi:alpha-beta hydrolase superfamily lysophospholipase
MMADGIAESRENGTMATDVEGEVRYDEEYVPAARGARLFARRWLPAAGTPVAVAVLAHGLGEHSGFYGPVTRYLLGRGLAVYTHDHRGFGRSGGRRGHVTRYTDYVEDLRATVERARMEQPGVPVVLIGHSMGGTIALLFSQRYPDLITHAIYSAPALILRRHVPRLQRMMARVMSRLMPTYTNKGVIDPTVLTRDPAMQQEVRADRWRHAYVTARLFMEMFVRGPRDVLAHLDQLRVPFLIIHGAADPLVSPAASRRVYHGAAAPSKAIRIYPGVLHEPFRDVDRERVFADAGAWLEEQGVLRRAATAGVPERS